MGEEGPPYPPRTNGYVDCLNSTQESALDEFCKQLPTTLEGLAAEHLTLWGVQLADLATEQQQQQQPGAKHPAGDLPRPQPQQQQEQAAKQSGDGASKDLRAFWGPSRAQKVVLLKFLRARQFNVQAALTMLVNCLKWRRDFDVTGLSLEMFPPQLGQAGQLSGRDRAGNPVTYNYYGNDLDLHSVFSSPGGVATFIRWRVKLMEQAVGLLDFDGGTEHVTQVHDYSGASMFRMDSNVKSASRQIIRLFQDNYPEMLSAKLFLNVPRVMEFIFGIFSAFSEAATRAKFVMVSPARARAVLLQYIDPAQVPARFGGFLETCSMPPSVGRAACFSLASKKVVLKPGESHVTSKLVGTDSEVVWCFCTTGPDINVTLSFRPRDNGEAAAAAARLPDHMPGATHPNSRHRDAQHINESHHMALVKDAASGRLVLGCPGEVVMTLAHVRATGGLFGGGAAPATVFYTLMASEGTTLNPHASLGALSECGDAAAVSGRLFESGQLRPLDWRARVISYKSLGCSSFNSNDVAVGDYGAGGDGGQPESPSGRGGRAGGGGGEPPAPPVLQLPPQLQHQPVAGANAGVGVTGVAAVTTVAVGRFATVQEVDESGAVSPFKSTTQDESELRSP